MCGFRNTWAVLIRQLFDAVKLISVYHIERNSIISVVKYSVFCLRMNGQKYQLIRKNRRNQAKEDLSKNLKKDMWIYRKSRTYT